MKKLLLIWICTISDISSIPTTQPIAILISLVKIDESVKPANIMIYVSRFQITVLLHQNR